MIELSYGIEVEGKESCLWRYRSSCSGTDLMVAAPVFEIDGQPAPAVLKTDKIVQSTRNLPNNVTEHTYAGPFAKSPDLTLELVFRVAPGNPVLRFRYRLKCEGHRALTKKAGQDNLSYFSLSLKSLPACKEVRFGEFDDYIHSFRLTENDVPQRQFDYEVPAMGPMLVANDGKTVMLTAYEHGSQAPDAFIEFHLSEGRGVSLRATKGNYCNGQPLDPEHSFETIWMQMALISGNEDDLAEAYRTFVLKRLTPNMESRKPYIYYNTWSYQERNKWWNKKKFLDSMNQERVLAEIDVAAKMGVDVFVLDTGWYEKTGDWRVNTKRFDENLKTVKAKLDSHGMKLGLWFSPTEAAVSSRILNDHKDCIMSWRGKESAAHPVWETEESQNMCLASRYWEAFARELIRLVKEVGVTYFKWDAIGQYGCDDPGHWHGDESNSPEERADRYAFELGPAMCRVVDKLCAECPEAIVDFDVTEGGRFVGLGFLSVGKYFLVNNGPYYPNYNIPYDWNNSDMWGNIFVYPGPARAWICRSPVSFDKWIPSVLFLTHYLPDDPEDSQRINIASLILGQNGIWGDPLSVSKEGVKLFGRLLGLYKQVRDDVTAAFPVRTGRVGGCPEVHEKICSSTGKGILVIFAPFSGRYSYVTKNCVVTENLADQGLVVFQGEDGRARVDATFDKPGAKIVFFGAAE